MNVQNVHYILSFENFYMHLSLISLAWFLPPRYYVIYQYPVTLKCALPLPSIPDAEIQHHPTPTGPCDLLGFRDFWVDVEPNGLPNP